MEIVKFGDAPFYTAPNHEGVTARRLQGGAASSADFVMVGHSTFPANADVPMEAGAISKVYIVTEGVVSIIQADGVRHDLQQWDSILIPAGEARAVRNFSGAQAAMIVITPPT